MRSSSWMTIGFVLILGSYHPGASLEKARAVSGRAAQARDLSLILMNHADVRSANEARDFVTAAGGRVAILVPPHAMLAWIPVELANRLIGRYGIESIVSDPIDPATVKYPDPESRRAVDLFNSIKSSTLLGSDGGPPPGARAQQGQPLINDTRHVPGARAAAAGNSDSMNGTVAVALLFLESDGTIDPNNYTWTDAAHTQIFNQVGTALSWWSSQASAYGANVTFTLVDYPPTLAAMHQGYEPILHSSDQDALWINAVMGNLGFNSGDAFNRTEAFNVSLKSSQGTNWAYSAIIGYNPSPAPSTFTDGYFAYAYLGGPYTQLLYRNDGWGIDQFGLVLTHETGHIFWACDEYFAPGYGGCTSCGICDLSGPRPTITNANCEYCNPNSLPCMMRENAYSLCAYTPQQIGWSLPSGFDYSLSNSGNVTVTQGSGGSTTISNSLNAGSPSAVQLSLFGLPNGASASFSPGICSPSCSSTLSIGTSGSTPPGTYPIIVTGYPFNKSTQFNLIVNPTPFNYSLTNSGSISVTPGNAGANTVTATISAGATQSVSFSASGLPSGAIATFGPGSCSPTCSSSLAITTSGSTPLGTFPVTVTGAPLNRTTQFNLVVSPQPFGYTLSNSGNLSITQGSGASNSITATLTSGAAQTVSFSASGLPAGVSADFSPASCSPNCSSTLTLNASGSTPPGNYSITVTGSPLNQITQFSLGVSPSSNTGCAMTTAIQGALEASDLLALAYRFRDEVLGRTLHGQSYIRRFYDNSPELVRLMLSDPGLLLEVQGAVLRYQPVIAGLVNQGRAVGRLPDLRQVDGLLRQFAEKGSSRLQSAVAPLRRDLRDPRVQSEFGIRFAPAHASVTVLESRSGKSPSARAASKPGLESALLVTDYSNHALRVYVGQPDGRLHLSQSVPVGDGPGAMVTGDFNGDGWADAVTVNELSRDLTIVFGKALGGFDRGSSFSAGSSPSVAVAADLNSDGALDLAVGDAIDNEVRVLLGRGDGSFQRGPAVAVGDTPSGIVAGDYNSDGFLDLAISNFGSGDIWICLGRGNGSFTRSGVVSAGDGPIGLQRLDSQPPASTGLVAAGFASNTVLILRTDALGRISVNQNLPAGEGPVAVAQGEIVPGRRGLAAANLISGEVSVFLENASGLFERKAQYVITPSPVSIAWADVDGDGWRDLVVLDLDGVTLRVLLNRKDGTFRTPSATTRN